MFNAFFGNWQTTLWGCLAAFFNYVFTATNTIPQTKEDWKAVLVSAALAGLGVVAKSANVGSKAIP